MCIRDRVYAEALFGLGVENGLLDTLLEELNGMCEILGKNPQFVTLLGDVYKRQYRGCAGRGEGSHL